MPGPGQASLPCAPEETCCCNRDDCVIGTATAQALETAGAEGLKLLQRISQLTMTLQHKDALITDLQGKIKSAEAEVVDSLRQSDDYIRRLQQINGQISGRDTVIKDLNLQLAAMSVQRSENAKLRSELATTNSCYTHLEEDHQNSIDQLEAATKELEAAHKDLAEKTNLLAMIQQDYDEQVEWADQHKTSNSDCISQLRLQLDRQSVSTTNLVAHIELLTRENQALRAQARQTSPQSRPVSRAVSQDVAPAFSLSSSPAPPGPAIHYHFHSSLPPKRGPARPKVWRKKHGGPIRPVSLPLLGYQQSTASGSSLPSNDHASTSTGMTSLFSQPVDRCAIRAWDDGNQSDSAACSVGTKTLGSALFEHDTASDGLSDQYQQPGRPSISISRPSTGQEPSRDCDGAAQAGLVVPQAHMDTGHASLRARVGSSRIVSGSKGLAVNTGTDSAAAQVPTITAQGTSVADSNSGVKTRESLKRILASNDGSTKAQPQKLQFPAALNLARLWRSGASQAAATTAAAAVTTTAYLATRSSSPSITPTSATESGSSLSSGSSQPTPVSANPSSGYRFPFWPGSGAPKDGGSKREVGRAKREAVRSTGINQPGKLPRPVPTGASTRTPARA